MSPRFPLIFIALLVGRLADAHEADVFNAVNLETGSGGLSSGGTSAPASLGTFNIVIQPGSTLASNGSALAAFQRAATSWAAYISDPVTIVIDADVHSFGAGQENIIGGASSQLLIGGYSGIRDTLVADDTAGGGGSISSALPTTSWGMNMQSLAGISFSGNVLLTKANAKALGFSASMLDAIVGTTTDATINFNSDFAFDYDRSDGISFGTIDFESVALHEIGHALGFISQVDVADMVSGYADGVPYITTEQGNVPLTQLDLSTLDLFRLAAGSALASETDFTDAVRQLTPGEEAVFFDGVSLWSFSTGVALGDGRQGSHWKDDGLTGTLIGAMDPTIGYGQSFALTDADLRALDLIGYDVASLASVPEPGIWIMGALGAFVSMRRRRG
ncbi:NF038122 family metalloprotease [Luteolibacter ambystomatis]|uniref:NF038122 family metalloprotease n=1 Tax=Luteolibacter ambystomatis TaxID=2824561 RepID=A0A975PFY3_9BACT|nr:NF038122 family metalloprotease [Luteolibacter ambystomatis]QUE52314.1 NF038122 family metalloprotease [Luteolibacter ambystomatis]